MPNSNLVGIISDTHDHRKAISLAVTLFNQKEVGIVFHAGDLISPFTANDFSKLQCPLHVVFGNNDGERIGLSQTFSRLGSISKGPVKIEYQGRCFILMHEPHCIEDLSETHHVDVVIYGHTHEIDVRQGKTLIINPGEAGGWLTGRATLALLELTTMKVKIEELPLYNATIEYP